MANVWTPEKAERRRQLKGWRPVDNRETQLPQHIYDAGRELREMMEMPTRDWVAKYATGAKSNGNDA